jgi:STE24 endopeptidase
MKNPFRCALLLALCAFAFSTWAADVSVALPPGTQIPAAAQPGPDFDPEAATDAYLALYTPEQRARSDAYFEGGYWLQLWNWLAGIAVAWFMLRQRWLARARDGAARHFSAPWMQTFLVAVAFLALLWLLTLPLAVYQGYFREHQYGSSNLTLGGWFGESLIGLAFTLVGAGLFITALYAVVRKSGASWWAWATAATFAFLIFVITVTPVFINPAFNDYKPLSEGETRDTILSMAHANQIPATNVTWFDASKQTKRISAHVAGMFGTTQISLNDNLLDKTSLPEIKSVMAHEMGHYVLNHGLRHAVYLALLYGLGYLILDRVARALIARHGERWRISGLGDPASLVVAFAVLSTFLFLAQPVINRIIYAGEVEADIYGLNAAREPHGFATVAMRLGSYRKLEPGPIETFLFYDHPSGRERVRMSMEWLKENQALFDQRPAVTEIDGESATPATH